MNLIEVSSDDVDVKSTSRAKLTSLNPTQLRVSVSEGTSKEGTKVLVVRAFYYRVHMFLQKVYQYQDITAELREKIKTMISEQVLSADEATVKGYIETIHTAQKNSRKK